MSLFRDVSWVSLGMTPSSEINRFSVFLAFLAFLAVFSFRVAFWWIGGLSTRGPSSVRATCGRPDRTPQIEPIFQCGAGEARLSAGARLAHLLDHAMSCLRSAMWPELA